MRLGDIWDMEGEGYRAHMCNPQAEVIGAQRDCTPDNSYYRLETKNLDEKDYTSVVRPCPDKVKEPLNNSLMAATTAFRDGMQGARRNAW